MQAFLCVFTGIRASPRLSDKRRFCRWRQEKQTILTSGDYQYVLLEDGSAELLYCLSDDAEIVLPDMLDGHRVTSIDTISFPSP